MAAAGALLVASGPPVLARDDAASLEQAALALKPGQYLWRDPGPDAGEISVVVSLQLQAVYAFRGDRLIGVASASTGTAGHRTPTGAFTILQKRVFHRSNLYSNAPMPFMQRLTWGGIALHAGHNPGYPASHGCIRLPRAFAKLLYDATRIGGAVAIVNGEWSVPSQERELPVIIAEIDELQSSPDYVTVTFGERAAPPPQQQLASLDREAASRPGLRVRGDEWLVPDARLNFPEIRRSR